MTATTEGPLRVLYLEPPRAEARGETANRARVGFADRALNTPNTVVMTIDDPSSVNDDDADVLLFFLPDRSHLDHLDRLLAAQPSVPVVVASADPDPDLDIAVIERGAEDFVALPVNTSRLGTALRLAAVRFRKRTPVPTATPKPPRLAPGRVHPLWKLEPGTPLDRYEVERIVGRGGMAVVYRVRHRKLGSVHALKVVLPSPGSYTQRLVVEGQAQARLRHPNLVRATDILELDPGIGLVMEYVEGPTLQEWMDGTDAPATTWLPLFRGIVRGIRHAHGLGLVHRDLKPANVLLQETDEGHVPKVADFGIAKLLPRGGANPLEGEPVVGIGTVGYVAPEQYRNPDVVDQRADLFSLGCVLYQLALGVPAFPGRDARAVIDAMRHGRYVRPEVRMPELAGRFSNIVEGLLQVDPGPRTPSCQALLEQLDGLDPGHLPARRARTASPAAPSTLDPNDLGPAESPWTTGWQPVLPPSDSPTR